MSVLLLNASYQPLRVISLPRAFGLLFAGKADLVDADDERTVRTSGGDTFEMPLTLRLRYMVRVPFQSGVPLNRRTLAARDGGTCQFVGCSARGNTMDHVVPRSRGGEHVWSNVVLACQTCNQRKAARTLDELGWSLKATPVAPRGSLVMVGVLEQRPEWEPYLAYA